MGAGNSRPGSGKLWLYCSIVEGVGTRGNFKTGQGPFVTFTGCQGLFSHGCLLEEGSLSVIDKDKGFLTLRVFVHETTRVDVKPSQLSNCAYFLKRT